MLRQLTLEELRKYEAVIWDLDGTLFDTIGIWNLADKGTIEHFGGYVTKDLVQIQKERDEFMETHKGPGAYLEYVEWLIEEYHLNCKDAEAVKAYKWDLVGKIQRSLDFKPGVIQFIRFLKDAGITQVLATNSQQKQLDDLFVENPVVKAQLDYAKTFSVIIRREDVDKGKPDKEIYVKALERLGLSPEKCLAIEDSFEGIRAALDANVPVLNVYDLYSDPYRENIRNALMSSGSIPTYCVDTLNDVFDN